MFFDKQDYIYLYITQIILWSGKIEFKMIAVFSFYLLLIAMLVVYIFYQRNQYTKELLIVLVIKINFITLLYILFFSSSQRVHIDDVMLNHLLK